MILISCVIRKAQKEGRAYIYGGKCAHLTKEEIAERQARGEKASIRFRAFKPTILVQDMIHGDIEFPTNAFGDFIIIRPDGAPIYNYVVVIDGATDKTEEVCKMINNKNLKIIKQENKGAYEARKNGIQNAKGKYIMFLDSDDTYTENTIVRIKEIILKNHQYIHQLMVWF